MEGDWNSLQFHDTIRSAIKKKHPNWSITGYAIAPEELTVIHVWCEGYRVTGDSSKATYHGHCRATSFQDACDHIFKDSHYYYNKVSLTYWGCRLFDNEADARRKFG